MSLRQNEPAFVPDPFHRLWSRSKRQGAVIPRLFHMIWLGPKPIPELALRCRDSWIRHHPGWEMRWWSDADVPPLINQTPFDEVGDMGRKPDILRYELLLRWGGVYLDTDMECQKNIEALIAGAEAFVGRDGPDSIGNAIVGAVPGHPFLSDAVRSLPESVRQNAHRHRLLDAISETGPLFLSRVVQRHPDVTLFAPRIFYPCHWSDWGRRNEDYPHAYAVHRWAGSWCDSPESNPIESNPTGSDPSQSAPTEPGPTEPGPSPALAQPAPEAAC